MEKEGIKYKLFEEKDIANLVKMHQYVFRKGFDAAYFKAKYFSPINNFESIATIAYKGNEAVGFYGSIQQSFSNSQRSLKCAHTCDSITMSNYQRKGIHNNLANLCYENLILLDYHFVYAFHSENTFRACQKLNWELAGQMYYTEFKTKGIPFQKIINKLRMENLGTRRFMNSFSPYIIDAFKHENPASKLNLYCNDYSNKTAEYRSFTFNRLVEILGVRYWLKADQILHIGFIVFSSKNELLSSLNALISIAKKGGYDKIVFHCDSKSKVYNVLKSEFEFKPSWKVGYLSFKKDVLPEELEFNYADLDTF